MIESAASASWRLDKGGFMARACTVCSHPNRAKIDEALVSGTAIRDIAGQHELTKSAVDRHRTHIGTALVQAAQRNAEFEDDLGDDLLGQAKALNRDLRQALEDAKRAKSLPAYLQVTDRFQKGLALQATLLERAAVASEGNTRFEISWIRDGCPHHPDGDCPLRSTGPAESPPNGSNGGGPVAADTSH